MTLKEILARMSEIESELESADEARLSELEAEIESLRREKADIEKEQKRKSIRGMIAAGSIGSDVSDLGNAADEERIANEFAQTRSMKFGVKETRSVLISGGKLATPTVVNGINDIPGAKYSSIIDFIKVADCEGMSTNRVAYIAEDASDAAEQTEGSPAAEKEPTFGYIDITPTSVAVTSQISKQAKKQSPLNYAGKVKDQAYIALRKKAVAIVTSKLVASELNDTVTADLDSSGKGVLNENTLRNITMSYGGEEGIGAGVLFLNKADLMALGKIRGTNEKRALYEITPDAGNPNVGIIKEGGLSVRYCLNSKLTACNGTAQSTTGPIKTMFYGDPMCLELDLFSNYEINVSSDFKFTSLMDTILGDVELGADVVVKGGFIALEIPKKTS